ncbi:50S ribosomal protein L25/general stress protein Ctc [Rhodovibrio salinarum]|uniref:Large ribosomal subunit protein bL25 n=1 Tax=Rhodovibrio salinarum TaxID=1087 RepID=A0A934V1F4_9PROT|nr:50S ribosomal protein L25/general stress protein Ctc [Rhodovibrio salinarum]MBK1698590.1 50S ribosomal protein L25 [Rhodovibrio salinarum]
MTETHTLTAQPRERAGKGAARRDRREGRVPGVIYGAGKEPTLFTIEPGTLDRELNSPGFFTRLFEIQLKGKRGKQLAICRDLQFDPVTDRPVHLDMLRVSAKTEVTVLVPVHFINEEECPGIDRGGVLNVVRHEVEMVARADNLPDYLEVDLTGYEINDSVHISAVTLPEGARPTIDDRDFTIATIAAPSAVRAEAAEEQEAAEEEAAEEAGGEEAGGEESGGDEGDGENKEE